MFARDGTTFSTRLQVLLLGCATPYECFPPLLNSLMLDKLYRSLFTVTNECLTKPIQLHVYVFITWLRTYKITTQIMALWEILHISIGVNCSCFWCVFSTKNGSVRTVYDIWVVGRDGRGRPWCTAGWWQWCMFGGIVLVWWNVYIYIIHLGE